MLHILFVGETPIDSQSGNFSHASCKDVMILSLGTIVSELDGVIWFKHDHWNSPLCIYTKDMSEWVIVEDNTLI